MNNPLLTNDKEVKFFGALGLILLFILVATFILSHKVKREAVSKPTEVVTTPFDDIHLVAKAAYVYDIRTGQTLYAKNENERLPLASITKVMTALVASDIAPEGTPITVTTDAILADGDSGLRVGERWALKDLLDFSLAASSNDGMRAVALTLGALNNPVSGDDSARDEFIRLMNNKAEAINLKNTYYFNETGLDESAHKGGAYGTARDMALLFAYVLKSSGLFEATRLSHSNRTHSRPHNSHCQEHRHHCG
jgi:D-alanyl-D-alanine carboxypeptidase (penicillin-binding protein 5/6)